MLYQLFHNQFKTLGFVGQREIVQIDGPHDKYGYVLSFKKDKKVYLIRGMGKAKPLGV